MRTSTLFGGLSIVLAALVYTNYRSPAPHVGQVRGDPIEASSYVLLAPIPDCGISRWSSAARRGLFRLIPSDRARCWALFRIIVDVFRHAPEQRDSLERVLRAYAIRPSIKRIGPGPCRFSRLIHRSPPKGDRSP